MISDALLQICATKAGLDLVAAVPVDADLRPGYTRYQRWLSQGYAGEMAYLSRADAVAKRRDPRLIFAPTKTVIVAAVSYKQPDVGSALPDLHGKVSMYAWGEDYHRWLMKRMKDLLRLLEEAISEPIAAKVYVDTGPVMERSWALLGGLGWIGKNACLINPRYGSWLFLAVALVDVEIETRSPASLPSCGTCTRCLDACPTGALVAPGVVDARKCLSYLTIEHRGSIPERYRAAMRTTVFGCDICQQVCPWNRKVEQGAVQNSITYHTLNLPEVLLLNQDAFRVRYRHSPIWRATAEGLARNAAVVLGNSGNPMAAPHLVRAVTEHPSPMVVAHAAWALSQLK